MLISFRTNCIMIGCMMFSLVPMVFALAYFMDSCEGGCKDRINMEARSIYLLIGMYSPIPISLLIDNIPRHISNDKIVQESRK